METSWHSCVCRGAIVVDFGPTPKWRPSLIKFPELPGAVRREYHAIQELSGVKGIIGPVSLVPNHGQQHLPCNVGKPRNPSSMNVQVCKGQLNSRILCLESRGLTCHLIWACRNCHWIIILPLNWEACQIPDCEEWKWGKQAHHCNKHTSRESLTKETRLWSIIH